MTFKFLDILLVLVDDERIDFIVVVGGSNCGLCIFYLVDNKRNLDSFFGVVFPGHCSYVYRP